MKIGLALPIFVRSFPSLCQRAFGFGCQGCAVHSVITGLWFGGTAQTKRTSVRAFVSWFVDHKKCDQERENHSLGGYDPPSDPIWGVVDAREARFFYLRLFLALPQLLGHGMWHVVRVLPASTK